MAIGNEKAKRYRAPSGEPLKVNFRLIASAVLILCAAVIKIMPDNGVKRAVETISHSSTDYPAMFSEIADTVKKYTLQSAGFVTPVEGKITSGFGERTDPINGETATHFGVDLDAPAGTEVKAAFAGKAVRCETNDYYGNFIIIDHPERGISTLYGHLDEIKIRPGDEITAGQIIALSGNTGRTTGAHLHFEVRRDNVPVDPLPFIK